MNEPVNIQEIVREAWGADSPLTQGMRHQFNLLSADHGWESVIAAIRNAGRLGKKNTEFVKNDVMKWRKRYCNELIHDDSYWVHKQSCKVCAIESEKVIKNVYRETCKQMGWPVRS